MQWQPVSPDRFLLAEGPFWDAPAQALYFVDIAGQLACRLDASGLRRWALHAPVSAFIPTTAGDALVTLPSGVHRLDLASSTDQPALQLFSKVDPVSGNRPNEARCDRTGRLWLGTMQNNLGPAAEDIPVTHDSGSLFRVDASGGVTTVLERLGIPNTLEWSADGRFLYHADSKAGQLYRYHLTPDGALGEREPWAADGPGTPDGSALDSEGYLWNARWGGGCLLRFDPDGRIDRRVELPASHPTSCVFGGPDLRTLYVTSAMPAQGRAPMDGAVFSAVMDVAGTACTRFTMNPLPGNPAPVAK
ncbi:MULTISPECIES: SMP-30/gluconolactonase/LRE family protein [Pseudomonas]|uniref:SMP-30/gluconolactonase/LRE family protein n=1 Tax=Pseudomonas quercus TaxID=2722792 RepID=A0ABX0YC31_9PSED|nr:MULTISPECIES: SMP-30/gluconolactonase/LRE family protein [Pseudomonas]MBF7141308.1 SMP-30/gluconolactonase/LRE family protein [Pseudomonas sp. LY10J]NJO99841.1 SMP-30/gluconolactonase/LRE family protein [Pseudomonas quercus]